MHRSAMDYTSAAKPANPNSQTMWKVRLGKSFIMYRSWYVTVYWLSHWTVNPDVWVQITARSESHFEISVLVAPVLNSS